MNFFYQKVDFKRLREEIRILQLECQQMNQEIDDSTSESSTVSINFLNYVLLLTWMIDNFVIYNIVDDGGWNCHACTFRNHPALNICEECGQPRPQGPSNISSQIIHSSGTHLLIPLIASCFLNSKV